MRRVQDWDDGPTTEFRWSVEEDCWYARQPDRDTWEPLDTWYDHEWPETCPGVGSVIRYGIPRYERAAP